MNVHVIPDTFDQEKYNALAAHPLQSWQWGEARKKMGIDILRLGEFEKSQQGSEEILSKVFLITFHPIPKTNYKIGYIPRSLWPSNETLNYLQQYGKEHKVIFFKIEPNISKKEWNTETFIHQNNINLQLSAHPLFPNWTQVYDLNKTEEEMLKGMHPKTRYNIRLAERKGVKVKEESTAKGYELFEKLYFETTKRQKYHGHTPSYHKTVWETMKDKIAHILIAYYEGKPLAAYELYFFNKTFYYPYGGSSDEHRNVMAANAIMWEAIKLGKTLGAESFDMWGSIAPDYDKHDPWAGFTRFKEGYGSQFVEMAGSYDLVVNPLLYQMYGVAHMIRQKLLSFKN